MKSILIKGVGRAFLGLLVANSSDVLAQESLFNTVTDKSIYDISLINDSRYDSNPFFQNDAKGVLRNTTTGKLGYKTVFDTSELYLNGGLTAIRSSQPEIFFNQELPQASANWIKYWERDYLDLRAEYAESSARITELTENGLLFRDNKREYKAISSRYVKELTSEWELSLDANKSYTNYQRTDAGLVGNDILKLGFGIRKLLNENLTALLNTNYTDFKPDNFNPIQMRGYTIGVDWWLNDQSNVIVNVGKTSSSSQSSATGSNYSLQFNHSGEHTNYSLEWSQVTTPSGIGILVLNNKVAASLTHDLNELWQGHVNISRSRNESSGFLPISTVFYNAEVGVTRQINADFKINIYAGLQQIDRGDKQNSEIAGLTLTYNFSR